MRPCHRRIAETLTRGSGLTADPSSRSRARPAPSDQIDHLDDLDGRCGDDEQLGDPHPRLDRERVLAVGVEQDHLDLSAIAHVDHARGVDDRQPVAHREPRPGDDEPRVAVRDRNCEPGGDGGPLPGADRDGLAGAEVEAGILGMAARRQHRLAANPRDAQLDHVVAADSRPSPATRYLAKRRTSR